MPRSTMRVPQPDIIEHFGNADAVPQLPERCLSRKAGIVRCCLSFFFSITLTILQYKLKSVGLPTDRPTLLHTQHIYYTTFVKAISIHNMHE